MESGVFVGPVSRVVNSGHLNEDGTISVLIHFGGQGYDLAFSPEQAKFIVQGLTDALKEANPTK